MNQLSQNLSRLQKTHKLSISEVARTTSLSRRTVDRILGRDIDVRAGFSYSPTIDTLQKLAECFDVGVSDVTKRLPKFVIDSVNPTF